MSRKYSGKRYGNVEAVDILHQVASIYISTKTPQDYGTGEFHTSTEVHMIKHIADNPGITVTELARDYGRTKGAISQILKKVEGKGLVCRKADPGNDNRAFLYLTLAGETLDQAHRSYDEVKFGESMNMVRGQFSPEEIDTAFQVLETWLDARREIQERRMERKKEEEKAKKDEKQV